MKALKDKKPRYYLSKNNEFVIENYTTAKPFANFFPGIAGKYGIPMWVFYVNRGQAIASFGTQDKDHAILEFFPANKSWQLVSLYGFRTFIKTFSGSRALFYEPFQNGFANKGFTLTNTMRITSHNLCIEEINETLGLSVKVDYFNIPNDSYAGMARIVTIMNLNNRSINFELIDGLPQVVPFGTSNLFLKKLGRTIEAWMQVENTESGVPFYKLSVDPVDRPEVLHITQGNFYAGFTCEDKETKIIKPLIDPESVFGPTYNLSYPECFLKAQRFTLPKKEVVNSKMASCFFPLRGCLKPSQEKCFYSIIGNARSLSLCNSLIPRITRASYLEQKRKENEKLISELQDNVSTESGSREFNLYAKQTYLDNVMRGGMPVRLNSGTVFYLYSRKHGDLERDYNKFHLQPTYFSQGNGNYRDMNQNRRSDIWFNPDINDDNLVYFLSLLQLDGFNPLVVRGLSFKLKSQIDIDSLLEGLAEKKDHSALRLILEEPFSPGDLILYVEENDITLKVSYDEFLGSIISHCLKIHEAEHGEGFWTDHWTYNLDLIETYLAVYPEKYREIFFENKLFSFYDNTQCVKPRNEKYIIRNNAPKQLHAVATDNAKKEMIHKRKSQPHVVRTNFGQGEIYHCTLISKLLCLAANKMASLDPFGCGIEMEADKPNWYDALNGLPALFGSSLCETFELKRLLLLIREALATTEIDKVSVAAEIHSLLQSIYAAIKETDIDTTLASEYSFWDKSHSLKENYWQATKMGVSGKELEFTAQELMAIIECMLKKIESGIAKAFNKKQNMYYSYFINEVTEYSALTHGFIAPTKFTQKKIPFFLEGQVHAIKLAKNRQEAKKLHAATKASELFDKALGMYKVTASLAKMPEEIGRCRVFSPGWLENESIWLHMEFKYLLELLKSGLYEDFFKELRATLPAFQKGARYGRSTLENSSFIVSSAFEDTRLHGNGFVARLSGSTAEFLQMWVIMNVGLKPFFVKDNSLYLTLAPTLPHWLFNRKGLYSFNFLSTIKVTYHNPQRKNTFGKNAAGIQKIAFVDKDGAKVELNSATIPPPYATQIRERSITEINIFLK